MNNLQAADPQERPAVSEWARRQTERPSVLQWARRQTVQSAGLMEQSLSGWKVAAAWLQDSVRVFAPESVESRELMRAASQYGYRRSDREFAREAVKLWAMKDQQWARALLYKSSVFNFGRAVRAVAVRRAVVSMGPLLRLGPLQFGSSEHFALDWPDGGGDQVEGAPAQLVSR